eukprot:m.32699 g.32699  ORF g.32699 m.32699 type:complete len:220 (+) comp31683_c0_seq2:222-881(+)
MDSEIPVTVGAKVSLKLNPITSNTCVRLRKKIGILLTCPLWSGAFSSGTMPVSINMGMRMPSWFDIYELSVDAKQDERGVKKAADQIRGMIDAEIQKGIPSHRIILGGFSQGGALALYTALTHGKSLGGVVALSSFLPLHTEFPKACGVNKDCPVFQAHGDSDPVVPYQMGLLTSEVLKLFLTKFDFKTYPGLQHGSSMQEMQDVKAFIDKILPNDGKL